MISIPTQLNLQELQNLARQVSTAVDSLTVRNIDLQGRRVINAGQSVQNADYVTRFELDALTQAVTATSLPTGLLNAAGVVRFGAFASRGTAVAHPNELFYASDMNYIGWFSTGSAWIYVSGIRSVVQADIATFTAFLGTNDAGCLVNVTDFSHLLRWSGTATAFAPGDDGSGYVSAFGFTPGSGTWGICDGSTYSYLLSDGTTANFVTPNLGTAAYLKLGTSATVGPTAASGVVTSESTHTHAVDPPSTTSGAPSATTTVDNDGALSTVAVGSATHTHATDIASFTSGAGSAHDHGPNTLELRRTQLIAYFRR